MRKRIEHLLELLYIVLNQQQIIKKKRLAIARLQRGYAQKKYSVCSMNSLIRKLLKHNLFLD